MKFNKPKKIKRSTLKKRADILFAKKVRETGICLKCGSTNNLQCAHIISRRYLSIRFDLTNAVCLCSRCHLYFTWHPLEWELWVGNKFGHRLYDNLKSKALIHKEIDYGKILESLVD